MKYTLSLALKANVIKSENGIAVLEIECGPTPAPIRGLPAALAEHGMAREQIDALMGAIHSEMDKQALLSARCAMP